MTRGLPCMSLRHAERAGVLAVGGAEGVVDVDVAELGELRGEVGVVLLLVLVEAEVLQQQHVAVAAARWRPSRPPGRCSRWRSARARACRPSFSSGSLHDVQVGDVAPFAVRVRDGLALVHQLRQPRRDRLERILRLRPALGPAEVRHEDQPPAALDDALDRRHRLHDPAVVGDLPALERDVEIDPHQHALPLHVDVGNGFLRHVQLHTVSAPMLGAMRTMSKSRLTTRDDLTSRHCRNNARMDAPSGQAEIRRQRADPDHRAGRARTVRC